MVRRARCFRYSQSFVGSQDMTPIDTKEDLMTELTFSDSRILVVGGAGFVGSNLVLMLLKQQPREIVIVDNFLSSDIGNVPYDPRVKLIFGSISNDAILRELPQDLDFVFHLAAQSLVRESYLRTV